MKNLGENCSWELTWKGKIINKDGGLDDQGLDLYLIQHMDEMGKIKTATFYSKSALDVTEEKIQQIVHDVDQSKVEYETRSYEDGDPDSIKVISHSYIPKSMGVTRAITELKLNGDSALVPPMDIDDYVLKRIADIESGELLTTVTGASIQDFRKDKKLSAKQIVEMEKNSWKQLTEYGTKVHAIFEAIFKGDDPKNDGFENSVFNEIVTQIRKFKSDLERKYPGCKFHTELAIKSKNLSKDILDQLKVGGKDSINGVIDLLVIDANGNGHIYDYKVSRKGIAPEGGSIEEYWGITGNKLIQEKHLWASSKKLSAAYQLEFYRQMCAQYGIKVLSTHIVPVKLNLEYNNSDNIFEVTNCTGINVSSKDIINDPGKRNNTSGGVTSSVKVNNFFDNILTTSQGILEISNIYEMFIPKNNALTQRDNLRSSVEFWKQKGDRVHKLNSFDADKEKGDYRIKWPGEKTIYCKESEVDEKIQELIEKTYKSQSRGYLDIAQSITNIKNGDANSQILWDMAGSNSAFFKQSLERYLSNDWTFVNNEDLNSIGILIFTKDHKCEIVCLSHEALTCLQNLGEGTTILGKTTADKNVDSRKILPALSGNLEMLKAMIYIAKNPDIFNKYRVAEIKALNPWAGIEITATNDELINSLNALIDKNPRCGLSKIRASVFLNSIDAALEGAKEHVEGLHQILEDGGAETNYHSEEWFRSKIDLFEKRYRDQLDLKGGYKNTPIWNAYVKLHEGLLLSRGFRAHSEIDRGDFLGSKITDLNGLLISSPQFSASTNIREVGQIIDEFAKEVRKRVFELGTPMKMLFKQVYDKYGTSAKVFDSWFADKERLILKDPNSPDFAGDPVTRNALDMFLRTMAKLRNPDLKTEQDFELAKQKDDYYAIPLLEARFSRQVKHLNLWQVLKNKIKENWTLTQGLFMGEELEGGQSTYISENHELYNKLKFSTMQERDAKITRYGSGMFETDLELVMQAALVGFCRSNVSKDYIPLISGLRMSLGRKDEFGSSKNTSGMANILKRFDDTVKSKFYGESIVEKGGLQKLLKFLNVIKAGFTTMTLAINSRSFLRETLQGIWTGAIRAGVELYPGIDEKNYIKAMTWVIQESHKNFSGVSLLQQLNMVYGMANMSLSQLENQRVYWGKFQHWGQDTLYLTATAPDFLHRMSLLVAKMMSDGSWEAHSLNENGILQYDIKKDKRFTHFVNNQTTHKDYLKEKSLYLTMVDDFNRSGFRNENGSLLDENTLYLPQAYTRTEGQSIKTYADLLYGHYDDESKSLLCDTFAGVFFLQYKTYITAKLEQWTMHGGIYNLANLEQQFDENGNELYCRYYEEDNVPQRDILTKEQYENLSEEEKKQCRIYYDYTGMPFQGMLQETGNVIKSWLSFDKEKISKVWSDPTTRTMFKLQLQDVWVMSLLLFLVNLFFSGKDENLTAKDALLNPAKIASVIKKLGPVESFSYNVIAGSLTDFPLWNILGTFTDQPPFITAVQRFGNTSLKLITGDMNIASWLTRNIGMIRDFQGLADRLTQK